MKLSQKTKAPRNRTLSISEEDAHKLTPLIRRSLQKPEGIIRGAHEDYQLQSNIRISVSLKAEYVQT